MPNQVMPMAKMRFNVNGFRAVVVMVLVGISFLRDIYGVPLVGGPGFIPWVVMYTLIIVGAFLWPTEKLANTVWITVDSLIDIVMIVLLMSISGGVRSGYGMLLLPFLAMSSLPVSGHYAMFYAAFASLCLLMGVSMAHWYGMGDSSDMFQAALLSLTCFVVSGFTWQIAVPHAARQSWPARAAMRLPT